MLKSQKQESRSARSAVSQMVAAAILCALAAGGIGTIVNRWLIGWMVMVAMAAVCLSLMGYGILLLATRRTGFGDKSMSCLNQKAGGIDSSPLSRVGAPAVSVPSRSLHSERGDQITGVRRTSSRLRQSI